MWDAPIHQSSRLHACGATVQVGMATFLLHHVCRCSALACQGARSPFASHDDFDGASFCSSCLAHIMCQLVQQGELMACGFCEPFWIGPVLTAGGEVPERGQLCRVVVGPTRGLSKNVQCRSLSSIHILYNHAPNQSVRSLPSLCALVTMFK